MEDENITHTELANFNLRLAEFGNKLDSVNLALARQEGANYPAKLNDLNNIVKNLETVRDSRAWIGEQVNKNTKDIEDLNTFKWKMVGIFSVIQVVITVGGKFILDAVTHSQVINP